MGSLTISECLAISPMCFFDEITRIRPILSVMKNDYFGSQSWGLDVARSIVLFS